MATVEAFLGDKNKLFVNIIPPNNGPKKPMHLIVCYDKSGSMHDPANSNGNEVVKLFSKHDLGKHSMEIISQNLTDSDTLEIIAYDSIARSILPRTNMNATGKENVTRAINAITPGGCTAIWDGLYMALQAADKTQKEFVGEDVVIVLITDGDPTSSPAEGELEALKSYSRNTQKYFRLHTIGIGYDIKSKLLADLAEANNLGGSFIFIPDGSMMITSWVNLLANEKCIYAKNLKVNISLSDELISLGTLKYGQPRSLILDASLYGIDTTNQLTTTVNVSYTPLNNKTLSVIETETIQANIKIPIIPQTIERIKREQIRYKLIATMKDMVKFGTFNLDHSQAIMRDQVASAMEYGIDDVPIIGDMIGQVAEGFATSQAMNRWGLHYVRSLISAHITQDCLNFKDPGPSAYGGEEIKKTREVINNIVNDLSPPVPSLQPASYGYSGNYGSNNTIQPVINSTVFTRNFNDQSGGCFGPDGMVLMNDNSLKAVSELKKGDIVYGGGKIVCVVKFSNTPTITFYGSLEITPYHPVIYEDEWVFPIDIVSNNNAIEIPMKMNDYVYNFVLDKGHILTINGINACTLGHNFKGQVIEHSFYGTNRVIEDLKDFEGYQYGLVELSKRNQIYHPCGWVCGYDTSDDEDEDDM